MNDDVPDTPNEYAVLQAAPVGEGSRGTPPRGVRTVRGPWKGLQWLQELQSTGIPFQQLPPELARVDVEPTSGYFGELWAMGPNLARYSKVSLGSVPRATALEWLQGLRELHPELALVWFSHVTVAIFWHPAGWGLVLSGQERVDITTGAVMRRHRHPLKKGALPRDVILGVFGHAQAIAPILAGLEVPSVVRPKREGKKQPAPRIYLFSVEDQRLRLRRVKLPPVRMVPLNADFQAWSAAVMKRLEEDSHGLVILQGDPGTGKTTWIRHLSGSTQKRLIIVQRDMINGLTGPNMVRFCTEELASKPAILVIEDAESLVQVRDTTTLGAFASSGTAALLNLSDGLLNDVTRLQIIVSVNCPMDQIDPALLRHGRLISLRHFTALSVEDGRAFAKALGRSEIEVAAITTPMTPAQIAAGPPVAGATRGGTVLVPRERA